MHTGYFNFFILNGIKDFESLKIGEKAPILQIMIHSREGYFAKHELLPGHPVMIMQISMLQVRRFARLSVA